MAKAWAGWVPSTGTTSNQSVGNTPDVKWNYLGTGYWWRAWGLIGSTGDGFTLPYVKVTPTATGWDIQTYPT